MNDQNRDVAYDPETGRYTEDPHLYLCRKLRQKMSDPLPGSDRSEPPPGMTIGYYGDPGTGLVSTRIFAVPGGSQVELAETQRVPRKGWEAVAIADAWAWYDRYAP